MKIDPVPIVDLVAPVYLVASINPMKKQFSYEKDLIRH